MLEYRSFWKGKWSRRSRSFGSEERKKKDYRRKIICSRRENTGWVVWSGMGNALSKSKAGSVRKGIRTVERWFGQDGKCAIKGSFGQEFVVMALSKDRFVRKGQ